MSAATTIPPLQGCGLEAYGSTRKLLPDVTVDSSRPEERAYESSALCDFSGSSRRDMSRLIRIAMEASS